MLLPHAFQGDVFFYYGLRNFHQNLRRYMDSRDDAQTLGWASRLKVPCTLELMLKGASNTFVLQRRLVLML